MEYLNRVYEEEIRKLYVYAKKCFREVGFDAWINILNYWKSVLMFYRFMIPPKIKERLKEDYMKVSNLNFEFGFGVDDVDSNLAEKIEAIQIFHEKIVDELFREGYISIQPLKVIGENDGGN